jgi:hypothetical protein
MLARGHQLLTVKSQLVTKCQKQITEDNIRLDLGERGREDADWMHTDQDRDQWWDLVNTVINLRAP